jgi:hypothetical protein
MKILFIILFIFIFVGCANSRQTYTPDGRVGHSINCSGTARNWGMCEEKAGEICKERGYDVLSANGDNGAIVTANNRQYLATTTISRTMLIACK